MSREADIPFTIAFGPLHPFLPYFHPGVFFAVGLFQNFFFLSCSQKTDSPTENSTVLTSHTVLQQRVEGSVALGVTLDLQRFNLGLTSFLATTVIQTGLWRSPSALRAMSSWCLPILIGVPCWAQSQTTLLSLLRQLLCCCTFCLAVQHPKCPSLVQVDCHCCP